jgi:hypothetical protein
MPIAYHLDYDDFPIVINKTINIPAGCLLFRGYHVDSNPVSDLPAHFGSHELAQVYGSQDNHTTGMFVSNKELKLLDLRFIIMLLRELLNYPDRKVALDVFKPFIVSYGLCSLKCQLEILNEMIGDKSTILGKLAEIDKFYITYRESGEINPYINPFEPAGIRLGITDVDKLSVLSLKNLLSKYRVDGFIAPQLFSPFHHNNRNREEIVIFDPHNSGIIQIPLTQKRLDKALGYKHVHIRRYISNFIDFPRVFNKEVTYLVGGGVINNSNINSCFDRYLLGDSNEISIINNYTKLSKHYFDSLDIKFSSIDPKYISPAMSTTRDGPITLNLTDDELKDAGFIPITPETLANRDHLKEPIVRVLDMLDK